MATPTFNLVTANNEQWLAKSVPDNTYHTCITDPPYGMGMAEWDHDVPPSTTWREVYRVLRPGAFLLSFCSPQLYHRMAVNVEDAGFRPMDMVFWIVTTKMAKVNRLKPAHEPIMVAQKPLDGSIDVNQAKWGCGRINIDDNRVSWGNDMPESYPANGHNRRVWGAEMTTYESMDDGQSKPDPRGRYPSNVIGYLDNSDHQRYFYAPRVTRTERGKDNNHPTPKPLDLMRYLCSVYAPVGGTVLDPFSGSGSTGLAAHGLGMSYVGIDKCAEYTAIAQQRFNELGSSLNEFIVG